MNCVSVAALFAIVRVECTRVLILMNIHELTNLFIFFVASDKCYFYGRLKRVISINELKFSFIF